MYSIEFLQRILEKIKTSDIRLSGVIIEIKEVGYAFLLGKKNIEKLREISIEYAELGLPFPFTIFCKVVSEPAKNVMAAIHRLNAEDNLPGVLKCSALLQAKAA